jgi:hypothetical protein
MKAILTKKRIGTVAILLVAAVIFLSTGIKMEDTLPGSWESLCEVDDILYPFEIVQAGDTLYLSYELYLTDEKESAILLYSSSDGCNWSEVEPPFFELDEFLKQSESVWRHDSCLFNTLDGNLGMVWVVTRSDNEKPRGSVFLSCYTGSTWSEPELLFQRNEACHLNDVMVLENGALLLLWDEPIVHQTKNGDKISETTGCYVIYRAYISCDDFLIERVMEPEDTWFCDSNGYSFVDDGHYIWCVFDYGLFGETQTIYRSGSEDGKVWSPPEPVDLPDTVCRDVFLTPDGEIGIIDLEVGNQNLYLLKSSDWENWSREKLLRTEQGIKGVWITEGKNNMMWGFVHTKDQEEDLFFIHSSKESESEYEKEMRIVTILNILSLSCIVLLLVFVLSWIWKYKNKIQY